MKKNFNCKDPELWLKIINYLTYLQLTGDQPDLQALQSLLLLSIQRSQLNKDEDHEFSLKITNYFTYLQLTGKQPNLQDLQSVLSSSTQKLYNQLLDEGDKNKSQHDTGDIQEKINYSPNH